MAVGGAVERGTATYETRFATAVEGYGTPREVAAAYLGTAPAHEVVTAYETGLATGFGLLASPLWAWTTWAGSHTFIFEGRVYEWNTPVWSVPLAMIGGALILIGMMHLIRWIGRGHATFAKAMLVRLEK